MFLQMVPKEHVWHWTNLYYYNMEGFSGIYIGENLITTQYKLDSPN